MRKITIKGHINNLRETFLNACMHRSTWVGAQIAEAWSTFATSCDLGLTHSALSADLSGWWSTGHMPGQWVIEAFRDKKTFNVFNMSSKNLKSIFQTIDQWISQGVMWWCPIISVNSWRPWSEPWLIPEWSVFHDMERNHALFIVFAVVLHHDFAPPPVRHLTLTFNNHPPMHPSIFPFVLLFVWKFCQIRATF